MCGIIGYIGKKEASSIIMQALRKLEYRGYDSAGIAVMDNDKISMTKCKGKLFNLEKKLEKNPLKGFMGIGHTRWATHGEPSDVNSHPHMNKNGTISVVHNGIIENYMSLREMLISKGYELRSDTDTEVIPHLIDYYYNGDLTQAVMKAVSKLKGSYAIGVMCANEPKKLIATRKDSPLIIGIGDREFFIASDIPAILSHTRDIYMINDSEFVILSEEGVVILDDEGEQIKKDIFHVTWDTDAAEKGGYDHFMLKEIYEQPKAIRDTMASRIMQNQRVTLDNIKLTREQIENIDKIYIVACGTASYASLLGKYVIEDLANIPVETECASEFRYRRQFINQNTLMILISQSGETADTLAALRLAKNQGGRVIAITNVVGSSIAREADDVLYTWAGPEIAVASTKAYLTQLIALNIIALFFCRKKMYINM